MLTEKIGGGVSLITRPDLWTANTEIDFGGGLYGRRATGTITASAGTQALVYLATVPSGVKMIYQIGGMWQYATNGTYCPVIVSNKAGISGSEMLYQNSTVEMAGIYVAFYSRSYFARADAKYDIWLTYTKS